MRSRAHCCRCKKIGDFYSLYPLFCGGVRSGKRHFICPGCVQDLSKNFPGVLQTPTVFVIDQCPSREFLVAKMLEQKG